MNNKKQDQKLIHHFLENSAKIFPDKTALIHEEIRATYAEINSSANQLARWFQDQGISIGDRVVLILENCLEYVVSYYGALKAGAVVVPLSSDLKPDRLSSIIQEVKPKVIVASTMFARLIDAIDMTRFEPLSVLLKGRTDICACSSVPCIKWTDVVNSGAFPDCHTPIDASDLASIIYTSGSTGQPKGVMLSHENIVSNIRSICQYLDITDKDIQMIVLPFFYVMGKSLLNTHFAVGGTVVLNNKFAYSGSVIQQMIDEKVTAFSGVPSTYAYLLHRSPLLKNRDRLEHLRYCSQAGGHMPNQLKVELRQVLPANTKIYIMYGASEASARLAYLEPVKFEEKMGSIGKAIPRVKLRILDPDEKKLPAGQIGELVASGPNIMRGYWKDKKATFAALRKNGYHTGDLGYQDEEGFFYLVGRKDNLLKIGGHRINPQEIEDVLVATGLVIEAVVLGLPDELLGYKLIGIVTPKNENCTEKDIVTCCAQKLPRYKLPKAVKMVRSIPKNASGKIDREKCMRIYNI